MSNSPWNNRPGNNFDDLMKNYQNRFRKMFDHPEPNKPKGFKNIFPLIGGAIFIAWLLTGFFILNEGERAVILRFGKYIRTATPGPNYHLPDPIETIIKHKVDRIEKIEIGVRSSGANNIVANSVGRKISKPRETKENLMLTGDENILDIDFIVQWRISNIKDYVFNVQSPAMTVKAAAESAMREVIGSTILTEAQTSGRAAVEHKVSKLTQAILDNYVAGVEIVSLQTQRIDPPEQVIDAFRDVQTARADKEREINQAHAYYNDVLPRARGKAAEIMQEAEGYKLTIVSEAEGRSTRFKAAYNGYKDAKQITRKRLYLETMEEVLKSTPKILLNNKEGNVLPYLPLDQLTNKLRQQDAQ